MQQNKYLKMFMIYRFLFLICFSMNLFAQNYWAKLPGPQGGSVKIIRNHPDGDIFLVTNYGYVHFSTDDGLSWTRLSVEPPNSNDMAISSDGQIYVAVWGEGIYKSDNKGDSWLLKANGLTNKNIYTISYDPNSNNLYAGTNYGGIFRSVDSGESWTAVNNGLTNYENLRIQSIHISPNGELYAAGWDWGQEGGLYVSSNDGDNWTQINVGNIRSVAADAENRLFCATYGAGIFRSVDGGSTWQSLVSGITTDYFGKLLISADGTIYAGSLDGGLFISSDHGDNWEKSTQILGDNVLSMTVKPSNSTVFVGMIGAGVFKSGDAGASWTEVNNGLLYSPIDDLIVTPEGAIFTSIVQSGIARSMDGGATWKRVNNGLTDVTIFKFAADTGVIFAGSQVQGVLRSIDGGNSWQQANQGIASNYVYTMFVDHHGYVYAGTALNNLYRSINSGGDWTEVYTAAANQSVQTMVSEASADVIFAGLSFGGGVIRSQNGGMNWEPANNGLGDISVNSLAVSPAHDILAGTEAGLYRSADNGDSWNRVVTDGVPDFIKKVRVNSLGHIFLAVDGNFGVFVSKDNGMSWKTENSGLKNLVVQAFAFGSESHLLVGIQDGGVYKSVRPTTEVQVHFTVKLKNEDGFDSSTQNVAVGGEFNGWATNDLILTSQGDGEMTYTGSLSLTEASEVIQDGYFQYKYVIPPNRWELFDYNRTAGWDGRDDLFLDTVWFSNQKEFSRMSTSAISIDGTDSRGVAWADFDNDGFEDVIIVEAGTTSRNDLFHNNGDGTFTQITTGPIGTDTGDSRSACWGDYNNDGYVDLYITNLGEENNFLYKNNGDGSFTRISSNETVDIGGSSAGALWADFDNDGFIDLFVANSGGEMNLLFMNDQDETFTRITGQSIVNDIGDSRGCAAADFDNDGDIDVFVANAGDGEGNTLYTNDGAGNFTGRYTGPIADERNASSGGSWGDYNNDGWLDLFVINRDGIPNTLFKNDKTGGFAAVNPTEIMPDSSDSRGSSWVDYDNDGLLDLYVTNAGDQKNVLYRQRTGGTFSRVSKGPLVEDPLTDSRGAAWGDFNGNGYQDLIVANNAGSNALYRNNISSNHRLNIKLIGTISNSAALGATILLYYINDDGSSTLQRRDVMGQSGFLSQNSMIASFGLGQSVTVDSIIIRWPSGTKQTIRTDIGVDRLLTITEPNPLVPPPATILIGPQNGAVGVSVTATLTWNQAGDATEYHVILADNASFNTPVVSDTAVEQTSYTQNGLQYDQLYYWRVRAKNEAGWGPWSQLWNFHTEQFSGTANPPLLNTPTDGRIDVPIPAPLTWTSEATGTYTVEVSTDNTFSNIVFSQGSIENRYIFIDGLQYNTTYFWRVNITVGGVTSTWSNTSSFTTFKNLIEVSVQLPFATHDRRDEFATTDYLLIGMPGNSNALFRDVLGDGAGENWMAYWDNGKTGSPTEYFVAYDGSSIFNFTTGRAYWIIANGTINVDQNIPAAPLNDLAQAEISIHSGWNMITCPFGHAVSWDVIKQVNGIVAGLPLYGYNRSARSFTERTALLSVEGFYFYNSPAAGRTKLLIPYYDSSAKPLAKGSFLWKTRIELASGETKSASVLIGTGNNAENGLDDADYRKPRALANLADIYFLRPEWDKENVRFGGDVRPPINRFEIWDFQVFTPYKGTAKLTFPEIKNIPENFAVFLIDKTRQTYQNLRDDGNYDFISVPEISNFEIIVGETETVEEQLELIGPMTFTLGQNYPNPFNPSTTIPLTLPEQSDVTLKVFNILGQEVITLFNGNLKAGRHYFIWDGTNQASSRMPSGIYIYQMTTNTGIRFTGKMVMIK